MRCASNAIFTNRLLPLYLQEFFLDNLPVRVHFHDPHFLDAVVVWYIAVVLSINFLNCSFG
jgi:hypothetical protein